MKAEHFCLNQNKYLQKKKRELFYTNSNKKNH